MASELYFGAATWPFRWRPPYQRILPRVARLGCKGYELVSWGRDMLADYYTPATIAEIRSVADGEGLTLNNFSCSVKAELAPGARRSRLDEETMERSLDVVAALGCPLYTMVPPYPFGRDIMRITDRPAAQLVEAPIESGLDWGGEFAGYCEALTRACAKAKARGLKVALEPHPWRWVTTASTLLRIIERTGADNLGMNLDPSHLFPCGDLPHYTAYMMGSRVYGTHFSDNDGTTNAHWRPGKGKIDWAALLKALVDVGYSGHITIELEDVPGTSRGAGPEEALEVFDREMTLSMKYLREAGEEVGVTIH
jgi:sugar phosphate isomerase/epimerase